MLALLDTAVLVPFIVMSVVMSIALMIVPIVFLWRILERAGLAAPLALLWLIPFGQLVVLGILAYTEWPSARHR